MQCCRLESLASGVAVAKLIAMPPKLNERLPRQKKHSIINVWGGRNREQGVCISLLRNDEVDNMMNIQKPPNARLALNILAPILACSATTGDLFT